MIINSESDYLIACGQLEELIDAIEDYEEKNYPIDSPVDDVMEYNDYIDQMRVD